MYSTCLFCQASLGTNEAVEAFPVGRRLAFDAAKGRLWVVCRKCERWNLTPLEERWEAIEQCERLFRDARLRASTDNVGLARLRDGTELVRIGAPQRPEMAAWRYGDQFGRRRMRAIATTGLGLGAIAAVVIGGATAGVGVGSFWWIWRGVVRTAIHGRADKALLELPGAEKAPRAVLRALTEPKPLVVRRRHLAQSTVESDAGGLALSLAHDHGRTRVTGPDALRVAARLLPHANRFGGSRRDVQRAVSSLEARGSAEAFLARVGEPVRYGRAFAADAVSPRFLGDENGAPFGLDPVRRLALEMALHEESERRAMDGELAQLEAAWRDAEEIAGIADGLLTESVTERIERLRGKRER